ncbi:16S rRNA (guanine(966)-N(2))-methyltransferase RsmD [Helcobacillus massiliensis]|uniref:16S rRNA (Guanine966-N2)-methyltransferase n=1 Tax=Helcobacillus massiliensis TaxID=521392 RepID=A0A839QR91_9MICO|nr:MULTISPECIES: 16S rRNA (guanine(966)-N(2))-methyltransferase RsmD [Helcobacillus]MBB3022178.1 16S rRNA (guanine966-N2)-methyltransferase [Helcobacillus massiliensis]MCG7426757.1 16S rRNA (guanine(966)-N(2))-methyltransferase RsmD [Helcobacillus sp. ACRRO]MCT1557297.1 16S rRNA (guanine(966)-N(2))-methyltransferase RsmD [Helcobacillus massiliensis]MCT2036224.1 16S rRNA (guanine(966)-N(2))-methyltransferase RsmD [Helcobacillus massiliensis]MCT2331582.1 16S rRNA (guanine(966)-N(2))-methyltransf
MPRIIAGALGGRTIASPPSSRTRPTSDRVRESLFGRLDAWGVLRGAHVLDLFGGTGALAFEALSRGAGSAVIVEAHGPTAQVIRRSAEDLGLTDQVSVITGRAESVIRTLNPSAGPAASAVFLDPPYTVPLAHIADLLEQLSAAGVLADEAVIVIEHSGRTDEQLRLGPEFVDEGAKQYGDTAVEFFTYLDPRISAAGTGDMLGQ